MWAIFRHNLSHSTTEFGFVETQRNEIFVFPILRWEKIFCIHKFWPHGVITEIELSVIPFFISEHLSLSIEINFQLLQFMNPFIDCAAAEPQIFPFNIWDQRCIETNKCTDLYTILLNIFPLTLGSPPDPSNLSFSWAATLDCIGKGRVFPGAWASSLVFPALANVKLLKTSLSLNISHQFHI